MKLDEDYKKVMSELQENFGWSNIDILPESYQDLLNDTIMAVKKLPIHGVINWAYFNDEKPNYGDQILIQCPPEQMSTPRVEIYDRNTTWIDGSRYAVITPCL